MHSTVCAISSAATSNMQAPQYLLLCLQQVPRLWQCIYFADNRSWLVLFLRWRLMSRAYNAMILKKDATDVFSRDMFLLLSDLHYIPSFPPPLYWLQQKELAGSRRNDSWYSKGIRSCVLDTLRA